jgi:hypothetical protein
LVAEQDSATFRTLVSLSSLVALYFGIGVIGIWLAARELLRRRFSERGVMNVSRVALVACTAFVAASAFFAAKNVTNLFAEPQMTELRVLRSQMAPLPENMSRVAFVGAGYYDGLTNLVIDDEFGLPSSAQPFVGTPVVLLVLREEGRLPQNAPQPIVDNLPWDTATLPTDEPVVDLRVIRRLR